MNIKKEVCIIGIDKFIHKNLYQAWSLYRNGIELHVLMKRSQGFYLVHDNSFTVSFLKGKYILPILQVGKYLLLNRKRLHHVEVYSGSSLAMFYVLTAKLLNIKVMVVERGDLIHFLDKAYNWRTRLSMWISYKLADSIWYKELHMKPFFNEFGASSNFLLPNAVPVPKSINIKERGIDFLWVNSLKDWRHPIWFAENIIKLRQKNPFKVVMIGLLGSNGSQIMCEQEEKVRIILSGIHDIVLKEFDDPMEYYRDARFFILPADIVFCNYALLEAMSHGVVPIVSKVEGAKLIVENNKNGILIGHSQEGLMQGMLEAMQMDEETWQAMSKEARRTVINKYSITAWENRLLQKYRTLGPFE